jgi:predicted enzyme related to lactoylglutathione lyase
VRPPVPDGAARRPPTGVEIVLEVADLAAERERVQRSGWPVAEEITERPWGLTDFRILDPDGYYLRITTA